MEIGFPDAQSQRLFNDYALLTKRYGSELAAKIATRLGVLRAAKHLALIPRSPPLRLQHVDGSAVAFSVELTSAHKLRFRIPKKNGSLPLDRVTEVEILDVQ